MSRIITLPAILTGVLTGLMPCLLTAQNTSTSSSYSRSSSSSYSTHNGSPTMSQATSSARNTLALKQVSLPAALATCAQLTTEELQITAAAQKLAQESRQPVSLNLDDASPNEQLEVVLQGSGLILEPFEGGLRIAMPQERGQAAEATYLKNFTVQLALKQPIQAQYYYVPLSAALSIIEGLSGVHVECPAGHDPFSFSPPTLVSVVSHNASTEELLQNIATQIGGTLCVTDGRVAIEIKRAL